MRLHRRGFLKSGLIAAPALIIPKKKSAAALLMHGGGRPAPSQAAAFGYTRESFNSDFLSLSEIDLNNTQAAGFKWYVSRLWPFAPASAGSAWTNVVANPTPYDPSLFTLDSPSVLKFGSNARVVTACANGAGYNGQGFGNGFYAEAVLKVVGTSTTGDTAFWTYPLEFTTGSATKFNEIDAAEIFYAADLNFTARVHQWDVAQTPDEDIASSSFTLAPDTDWHVYGVRWVPMAQNGGMGRYDFYRDNLLINGITYTSGNNFSFGDSHNQILAVSRTTGAPDLYCNRVTVWQL